MAGHADFDATRRLAGAGERRRGDSRVDTLDDLGMTGAVSALVLCGGQSRRMGTDKALIPVAGRTLLAHAVHSVSRWTSDIHLACGPTARYADSGHPLCLDRWPGAGPLAGIEAGLSAVQPGWCLVLACDMPRVDPGLFGRMLHRAVERELDVCWLESAGGIEPLCGVYHTRVAGAVRAALIAGERKVTSFTTHPLGAGAEARLARVEAYREPRLREDGGGEQEMLATNLNTPEDVRLFDGALRAGAEHASADQEMEGERRLQEFASEGAPA